MMAQAGLLGLFTAGDLILFYVFWEFMLIPFALLIWNWGGGERRSAGMAGRYGAIGQRPDSRAELPAKG